MNHPLLEKIKLRWSPSRWRAMTIVVGCSGGADSTALLRCLCKLKPLDSTIVVAHFNHRLRGQDSADDARFVIQLAEANGCLWTTNDIEKVSAANASKTKSDEAYLRDERYGFLAKSGRDYGARYVVLAHTADDSVETVLHNLMRGSGLSGMTGIPAHRKLDADLVLVRPMIDVWRSEVMDFLDLIGQDFRIDASNESAKYTRNRIRHDLLPKMESVMESPVKPSIHRLAGVMSELLGYLHLQAERWLDRVLREQSPWGFELATEKIATVDWPMVQNALHQLWQQQDWPLRMMTHDHWTQIRDSMQNNSLNQTNIDLPGKIKFRQVANGWRFEKVDS